MRKSLPIFITAFLIITMSAAAMAVEVESTGTSSGVVNINTADVGQLSLLPRIGAKVAQRIVDYRQQHGAFKKTSDLMQVKGFGEKSFERLAAYVTVEGKTTLSAKVHTHSTRARKSSSKKPSPAA